MKAGLSYSHENASLDLERKVEEVRTRLLQNGDTDNGPLAEKLSILQSLTEFELGRFLLINGGLNGRWSHYVFYEYPRLPADKKPTHPVELRLLEIWSWASARERYGLVHRAIGPGIKNGVSILSLPCGVMAELLELNFTGLKNFELVGVDLDSEALDLAKALAQKRGLLQQTKLVQLDAFQLQFKNRFDFAISIGLNIYLPTIDKVLALYKKFFEALKPGGKFLATYSTPPNDSERDLTGISAEAMHFRNTVLSEILQIRYRHLCTTEQITGYLKQVGFTNVEFYYSSRRSPNLAIATKGS